MKKILFNDIKNYPQYINRLNNLLSDYEKIRGKYYSNKCLNILSKTYGNSASFLTHSATAALEIIANLIHIKNGDEIIMPSFTFVSTANAFAMFGATPVFVDIEAENLNINIDLIEAVITPKTKAIVAMHYAGNACDMERLKTICNKHNLYLIEDAAMGFGNKYLNQPLGTIGDFGVISFDITKQVHAIQGGLLLVNNLEFVNRAKHIYYIGTNKTDFEKKEVPYYEWVDFGSKYQMNELNALVLHEQLIHSKDILAHRQQITQQYYLSLQPLEINNKIKLMNRNFVPQSVHEFYIILNSEQERDLLSSYLKKFYIESLFHYVPLHTSKKGKEIARYSGGENTKKISQQILRLPLHPNISIDDVQYISSKIKTFFYEG